MTCHKVQLQLALYLYGELDFAAEETVEEHLAGCASCQQALSREKTWQSAANAEYRGVSYELLSACRQDLHQALSVGRRPARRAWWNFLGDLKITPTRWSYQLAVASFLVFLGFTGARLIDRSGSPFANLSEAGLIGSSKSRIRDIQSDSSGQIRIILDQVNQRELVGSAEDANIRRWLLVAIQDPADPGIRVDSVEMLSRQTGDDVRDALLQRVVHDPNSAVRLKSLECLRTFAADPGTRTVLRGVLEHDSDPAVRSEAIDILVPANQQVRLSPDLAITLENLARSEHDEYVRGRCLQLLHPIHAPLDVY